MFYFMLSLPFYTMWFLCTTPMPNAMQLPDYERLEGATCEGKQEGKGVYLGLGHTSHGLYSSHFSPSHDLHTICNRLVRPWMGLWLQLSCD